MTDFPAGQQAWINRLGLLRNVVRQEMIHRQVAPLVSAGSTVLDVGSGQGTQALRLASLGCTVTAVDPSPGLLELCIGSAAADKLHVEVLHGALDDLPALLGDRTFDLVCCHGVMMYLEDWPGAIATIGGRTGPGGHVSLTFRNGHALAMRPGLRGEWAKALAAFDSADYVNELGLLARANRVEEVDPVLTSSGFGRRTWYGVRVLTDAVEADVPPPDPGPLAMLLDAEERAGSTEPYKWMGSQLHVVASRSV
jgi:S-adenosylmethionine-dependent methyltransferase